MLFKHSATRRQWKGKGQCLSNLTADPSSRPGFIYQYFSDSCRLLKKTNTMLDGKKKNTDIQQIFTRTQATSIVYQDWAA